MVAVATVLNPSPRFGQVDTAHANSSVLFNVIVHGPASVHIAEGRFGYKLLRRLEPELAGEWL